ncbi:hypothetical protein HFP15_38840 [Amycolatopsis sp. K13G38]|uniref:DNA primase/polymerase bifunctional N-terminal domain-containing protein n=1 Tax=Amycolatopsis acididurans TaxID=2724524 RepID=A0ABX1JG94_9PSEU|nr:hypothetical protein [Amycolatopsis acididurans]NKQ58817.1 hypothetical protein [Amycolatopsis acididurans]
MAVATLDDLDQLAGREPKFGPTAQRCSQYYNDHGLPVALDFPSRCIFLTVGGLVGAITTPAPIGTNVLRRLDIAMSGGPVVIDSGRKRWIFLTGSPRSINDDTAVDLLRLGVTVHKGGERLALPTPDEEQLGLRQWQRRLIAGRDLPLQSLVIAMIRIAGSQGPVT